MKFHTLILLFAVVVVVVTQCTLLATAAVVAPPQQQHIIQDGEQPQQQVRRGRRQAMIENMGIIPSITKLRLINTDTDQPIAMYDPLLSTTEIDLSTLSTTKLNVEAVTLGNVSWIQWNYNGIIRNEYMAPWALCGNNGTDFFPCVGGTLLSKRSNATLSVTPYYRYHGGNKTGTTLSTKIVFYQSNVPPPTNSTNSTTPQPPRSGINFTLINAVTNMDIGPLLNDTRIDLSLTPQINIRANPSSILSVGSVVFKTRLHNLYFNQRIENVAPYAYYGNAGTNYFAWTPEMSGNYTLTATVYSERNGQGDILSNAEVTFIVVLPSSPIKSPVAPASPPAKADAPVVAPPVAVATNFPTPTVIIVQPPTRDTIAPKLLSFHVLDPVVDASNGNVTARVEIVVQDDRTGLGHAVVGVYNSHWYFYADDYIPSTPTGNAKVPLTFTMIFTKYIPQGNYSLFCWLRDDYYNSNDFNPPDLAALNYTSYITVINRNQDIAPPTLLNLVALTPTTVDVSNGPANVTFQATVQDLKYGIVSTTIFASGAQQRIEGYTSLGPPFVGTYEFIITLTFPAFTPPTNYTLEVHTRDNGFNEVYINSTILAARGFPSMVQVTNSVPDVTPPALLNLKITPSTLVNASAGFATFVQVSLRALDTESGVWYCRIIATYNGNQTLIQSPRVIPYPIKEEFRFTGFFAFDSTSWLGNYTLSILLGDDENNEVTITTNELFARGFPAMFTVV